MQKLISKTENFSIGLRIQIFIIVFFNFKIFEFTSFRRNTTNTTKSL